MTFFYRIYYYTARLLFTLFTRRRLITGLEHIPAEGPLIMVSNHLSLADPIMVMGYLPRQVYFMTKVEAYYSIPLRWLAPRAGAFPVSRGRPDRVALRRAEEELRQGHILGLYPEGHRSETGQIQDARAGVVFLAMRSGAPILPVAIWGTERIFKRSFPFLGWPAVHLAVGRPFRLEELVDNVRGADKHELANLVLERVGTMLPDAYRRTLLAEEQALVSEV